jgi:hypothetical protein
MEKKFGFYPYPTSFAAGKILIEPLPDIESRIAEVIRDNRINNGWYCPPLGQERLISNAIAPIKPVESPWVPVSRFQLPATHVIRHPDAKSSDRVNFLILCIGFLLGMRLVPESWGHFFRTPIQEHRLTDLITSHRDVERCIPLFDKFWIEHRVNIRRNMFSALNVFQFASSYEHQYEEFIFQYVALDSIYRIFVECGHIPEKKGLIIEAGKRRRVFHAERPRLICKEIGVPIPKWARKKRNREANVLSDIRNDLFHEGLIDGEPVGFGFIREDGIILGAALKRSIAELCCFF